MNPPPPSNGEAGRELNADSDDPSLGEAPAPWGSPSHIPVADDPGDKPNATDPSPSRRVNSGRSGRFGYSRGSPSRRLRGVRRGRRRAIRRLPAAQEAKPSGRSLGFEDLPAEAIAMILQPLDPESLLQLRHVNKRIKNHVASLPNCPLKRSRVTLNSSCALRIGNDAPALPEVLAHKDQVHAIPSDVLTFRAPVAKTILSVDQRHLIVLLVDRTALVYGCEANCVKPDPLHVARLEHVPREFLPDVHFFDVWGCFFICPAPYESMRDVAHTVVEDLKGYLVTVALTTVPYREAQRYHHATWRVNNLYIVGLKGLGGLPWQCVLRYRITGSASVSEDLDRPRFLDLGRSTSLRVNLRGIYDLTPSSSRCRHTVWFCPHDSDYRTPITVFHHDHGPATLTLFPFGPSEVYLGRRFHHIAGPIGITRQSHRASNGPIHLGFCGTATFGINGPPILAPQCDPVPSKRHFHSFQGGFIAVDGRQPHRVVISTPLRFLQDDLMALRQLENGGYWTDDGRWVEDPGTRGNHYVAGEPNGDDSDAEFWLP